MSYNLGAIPSFTNPRKALEMAAEQFDYYAKNHREKARSLLGVDSVKYTDALMKADVNEAMSRMCRNSLKRGLT